jgi:hypothetical protein
MIGNWFKRLYTSGMSLTVTVVCPEGVVVAADSRVTLSYYLDPESTEKTIVQSNFDNATKLMTLKEPHDFVAISTVGAGTISDRTIHSFAAEFQETLGDKRLTIKEYADKLETFYQAQWDKKEHEDDDLEIQFQVAGLDKGEIYGELYNVTVPKGKGKPIQQIKPGVFNVAWNGDVSIVTRLVNGIDPNLAYKLGAAGFDDAVTEQISSIIANIPGSNYPISTYALQDGINLARFLIKSTVQGQNLLQTQRTVGGNIDICVIKSEGGCSYISRKELS